MSEEGTTEATPRADWMNCPCCHGDGVHPDGELEDAVCFGCDGAGIVCNVCGAPPTTQDEEGGTRGGCWHFY